MTCELCRARPTVDNDFLCEVCYPDECYKCSASSVSFDGYTITCSHGCEYDVHTHMSHRMYTVIMNGTWRERLRHAGDKIEFIITDPSKITVHQTCPPKQEGMLRGIHLTPDADHLLEDGYDFSYCEIDHREGLRDESAYAWPFVESIAEDMWSGDMVFFKMPEDAVVVSSYRFIDWIGETGRWAIPHTRYEEQLVFSPEQLFTLVAEEGLPCSKEDLLYFRE